MRYIHVTPSRSQQGLMLLWRSSSMCHIGLAVLLPLQFLLTFSLILNYHIQLLRHVLEYLGSRHSWDFHEPVPLYTWGSPFPNNIWSCPKAIINVHASRWIKSGTFSMSLWEVCWAACCGSSPLCKAWTISSKGNWPSFTNVWTARHRSCTSIHQSVKIPVTQCVT